MSTHCYPSIHHFEIRFESLFKPGRALCFPCDNHGEVNLDELPALARQNYYFARAMVGKDFSPPALCVHD